MRNLSAEEKAMIKHVLEEGVNVLQQIQELKESLKEDVKALSEQIEVKPSVINRAIKVAHKRNLPEMQNSMTEVEEVLVAGGKKA